MISARPRLSRLLAATSILILASSVAAAPVPTPPITPKPAGPMPVPYPNPDPPTTPECPASLCPKAAAALQLEPGSAAIEVQSFSWGAVAERAAAGDTSDPQEGGQVYTSDPQEGGQVARTKPKISEIPVVKLQDKSSATLSRSAPGHREKVPALTFEHEVTSPRDAASGLPTGKRMHKPMLALADPLPTGTVTIVVARGACVKGQHIPEVKLTTRKASYDLKDIDVLDCAAVGDDQDKCTLTYASLAESGPAAR
jgi:hypothetical protein